MRLAVTFTIHVNFIESAEITHNIKCKSYRQTKQPLAVTLEHDCVKLADVQQFCTTSTSHVVHSVRGDEMKYKWNNSTDMYKQDGG
jgi:hypothetical protein